MGYCCSELCKAKPDQLQGPALPTARAFVGLQVAILPVDRAFIGLQTAALLTV